MLSYALVFFGSGIGGALRFFFYRMQGALGVEFPLATLFCNTIGSFTIVIFASLLKSAQLKMFLMAGLLGGFTTYSTFVLEIPKTPHYVLYILANVCIIVCSLLIYKFIR